LCSRLLTRGILICDDYTFSSCPGATRAVDEFLADRPEKMLPRADGGGFLIKNVRVAPQGLLGRAVNGSLTLVERLRIPLGRTTSAVSCRRQRFRDGVLCRMLEPQCIQCQRLRD